MTIASDPHPRQAIAQVAVFCGSRIGTSLAYAAATDELGAGLAARGIGIIYGGGRIGLMGRLADAALEKGGVVAGIIPEFLSAREVAHSRVTELVTTASMHSRKQQMFSRADAFVTMPGGLGTLDETVEIVTWRQLGLHDKPIIIVDIDGWARGLIAALDAAVADGFADPATRGLYEIVPDVASALRQLEQGAPADAPAETDRV